MTHVDSLARVHQNQLFVPGHAKLALRVIIRLRGKHPGGLVPAIEGTTIAEEVDMVTKIAGAAPVPMAGQRCRVAALAAREVEFVGGHRASMHRNCSRFVERAVHVAIDLVFDDAEARATVAARVEDVKHLLDDV